MVTFLLIVLAAVLGLGMVGMVAAALKGCFLSTLWVCWGGLGSCAELFADLLGEIASGLKG